MKTLRTKLINIIKQAAHQLWVFAARQDVAVLARVVLAGTLQTG